MFYVIFNTKFSLFGFYGTTTDFIVFILYHRILFLSIALEKNFIKKFYFFSKKVLLFLKKCGKIRGYEKHSTRGGVQIAEYQIS